MYDDERDKFDREELRSFYGSTFTIDSDEFSIKLKDVQKFSYNERVTISSMRNISIEENKSKFCKTFGHKASEGPDNNDTKLDVDLLIVNKEEPLTKKVLIGDLILDTLADSGSRVTLIRKSVLDELNHVQLFKLNSTFRRFSKSKKYSFHDDYDQRTVTVNHFERVPVELQHPSDLPKLEDGLKRLEKPEPMIQCNTEEPGESIVAGTEELHLENCLQDVKEDNACIPLKKTDQVVIAFESMPKEVERRAHDKRRKRIKESKDYYFISKLRQKI
ncbi:elongation factor 2 [Trichonephila clavipes]|nr:elongation factor 2 [Trichonephila clavipes]